MITLAVMPNPGNMSNYDMLLLILILIVVGLIPLALSILGAMLQLLRSAIKWVLVGLVIYIVARFGGKAVASLLRWMVGRLPAWGVEDR